MFEIVRDPAKPTFQKLPTSCPLQQRGRLSTCHQPPPPPAPTRGISDQFRFYLDLISKQQRISGFNLLFPRSLWRLGPPLHVSGDSQPALVFRTRKVRIGAVTWLGPVHGELSLGQAAPPQPPLPPTPKPGNKDFPLPPKPPSPPPGPSRWGRPPSGPREEASSSIVPCGARGCRKRPRGPPLEES